MATDTAVPHRVLVATWNYPEDNVLARSSVLPYETPSKFVRKPYFSAIMHL